MELWYFVVIFNNKVPQLHKMKYAPFQQCMIQQCMIQQCMIQQCMIQQCMIQQCMIQQCIQLPSNSVWSLFKPHVVQTPICLNSPFVQKIYFKHYTYTDNLKVAIISVKKSRIIEAMLFYQNTQKTIISDRQLGTYVFKCFKYLLL